MEFLRRSHADTHSCVACCMHQLQYVGRLNSYDDYPSVSSPWSDKNSEDGSFGKTLPRVQASRTRSQSDYQRSRSSFDSSEDDSNSKQTSRGSSRDSIKSNTNQREIWTPVVEQNIKKKTRTSPSFDKLPRLDDTTRKLRSSDTGTKRHNRSYTDPMSVHTHNSYCSSCNESWERKMVKEYYGVNPQSQEEILKEKKRQPQAISHYVHNTEELKLPQVRRNRGYFDIHPDFVSEKENAALLKSKRKHDKKYWGVTF